MVIYSCDNLADAFHAIQEITTGKDAQISFLSENFAIPKDMDSLDVDSLPVEVIKRDVLSLSGDELMIHYKECNAKGLFLSFPFGEGIVFRLLFFGGTILVISVLSKTKICVDVPGNVDKILEKYKIKKSIGPVSEGSASSSGYVLNTMADMFEMPDMSETPQPPQKPENRTFKLSG